MTSLSPWRRLLCATALLTAALAPSARADDGAALHQLCIWKQDGQKATYLSTDEPGVSPAGECLRLTTRHLTLELPRADVECLTVEAFDPTAPTDVSLPATLELTTRRRDAVRLDATLTPADAVTSLSWTSSRPDVLTVAPDGTLTPLAPGEATVTVRTANGLAAQCRVSVVAAQLRFFVYGERYGDDWCLGYDLYEEPAVESRGSNLVLVTNTAAVLYPRSEIHYFALEDVAHGDIYTRIETLPADDGAAAPAFRAGDLTFSHLSAGERVCVYDAAGRLAAQSRADEHGALRLPTQPLPAGVYVVKTERMTFKIQKQ